jgi:Predicted transmembrane sensor domain
VKELFFKYKNYLIFLLLLILLISLKIANPSFIKSISFLSFDLYQKFFPLKKDDSNVVIIDIDEKSLGKFGQFPWNRTIFAKIIKNVNSTNPKSIGFDVFFAERDKQSPEEIISAYNIIPTDVKDLQNLKDPDEIFENQLSETNVVLAVLGSNDLT